MRVFDFYLLLLAATASRALPASSWNATVELEDQVELSPLSKRATQTGLSAYRLTQVTNCLASQSTDTWVSGTRIEALLELSYPSLSVFAPSLLSRSRLKSGTVPSQTNSIISQWWSRRPAGESQQMAVWQGGAAADPASLGVGWIIAAETTGRADWWKVCDQQVNYLTRVVKRTSSGALSMRQNNEDVQLWADFVYMVPPYLAYYGVIRSRPDLVLSAYTQCALYRTALRDSSTNLWRHVTLGTWQDHGLWATGNAWAAAGMVRVIATIQHSNYKSRYAGQTANLAKWTDEILVASFSRLRSDNLLPNYFGVGSSSTFSDAASSALLASVAFRMASLGQKQTSTNLANAERIRKAVNARVNSSAAGWVTPVVDPLLWQQQTSQSPEAQAFVLLLQAAWRDWYTKK